MKILYAIQGTGNGHLSRAIEIIPHLKKIAEVDILISGTQSDLELPFKVNYKLNGLSFVFGKRGGISLLETYKKSRIKKLFQEIKSLPVKNYDLVISDFEPVSCWAAKKAGVPCVGLSNQAAVMAEGSPQPKKFDPIGKLVLKYYAPCDEEYGFHFQRYNPMIYTPIIRSSIRKAKVSSKEHYTIYLPSFDDKKIIKRFSEFKNIEFHVFSKHSKKAYKKDNIKIEPITEQKFFDSLTSCKGVITGAGFGTTSESLFLGKKLLVIPMKMQFEQQCNALALKKMGVTVIRNLKNKNAPLIKEWIKFAKPIPVIYPDETAKIINTIVARHIRSKSKKINQGYPPVKKVS